MLLDRAEFEDYIAPSSDRPVGPTDYYCFSPYLQLSHFILGDSELWTTTTATVLQMHMHDIMQSKNTARTPGTDRSLA